MHNAADLRLSADDLSDVGDAGLVLCAGIVFLAIKSATIHARFLPGFRRCEVCRQEKRARGTGYGLVEYGGSFAVEHGLATQFNQRACFPISAEIQLAKKLFIKEIMSPCLRFRDD